MSNLYFKSNLYKICSAILIRFKIRVEILKKFLRRNRYFIVQFNFTKPKKNDVLVYSKKSEKFAKILFNEKITFYHPGLEKLNLYIIAYTIFKNGFHNLVNNYKFNFINFVKPKIVYTAMDNYIGFYKLKNIYPKAIYVSDQNAMRNISFLETFKKIKKNNNLHTDIFFCFGKNQKEILNKIFKSKIYALGNTINNSYKVKKIEKRKKIKKLIYISSGKYFKHELGPDINIFFKLMKYCKEKKIKLIFLDKPNRNRKKFFENIFGKDFHYMSSESIMNSYKLIEPGEMYIFTISTFGYEILSRGVKCVSLNHNQFNHKLKPYKNNGPFWIEAPFFNYDYFKIKKKINLVKNLNNKEWQKIYKKYSSQILNYDKNNLIKKKILYKILKN